MNKISVNFSGMTLLLSSALSAPLSLAQNAVSTTVSAQSSGDLGTIVVTAQKREEVAQDVPISLYAVSGKTLEEQGIGSLQDLATSVAGIQISQVNPGQSIMSIRGLSDFSESNSSTSVNGLYLDEVPINWLQGFMPELGLWDIDRIEVLRGPQGTLFGEGAEGGTVRVISKKPDSTQFFGRYEAGVNATSDGGGGLGGSGYDGMFAINLPLVQNELAASLAVGYTKLPGWIAIPDLHETDNNFWKSVQSKLAVRYTPSSALSVDVLYLMNQDNFQDFAAIAPDLLDPHALDPAAGLIKANSPDHDRLDIAAITINYDMGFASLVSASSWQRHRNYNIQDLSFANNFLFGPANSVGSTSTSDYNYNTSTYTQEFRLVSPGHKRIDWTVGVFGKSDRREFLQGYIFDIPALGPAEPYLEDTRYTKTAWAAFADTNFEITNQFSVQAGVRYYSEKNTLFDQYLVSTPLFGIIGGTLQTADSGAHATSPKFGLTYNVNSDVLVYAKVSKGFRGGGANAIPLYKYPYVSPGYGSDTLTAYEVGLKTTPAPSYYLNVYAYDNHWTDLQLPFSTADHEATYTANAGNARAYGTEIEAGGKVAQGLTVGFNFSYIDAYIGNNILDTAGDIVAHAGYKLPQAPPFKYAVTAAYTLPLTDSLQGLLNVRYRQQSGFYSDTGDTPLYFVPQIQQLYASIGLTNQKWGSVLLYGDNLLNRSDETARFPPLGVGAFPFINYIRPRNIGIQYKNTF